MSILINSQYIQPTSLNLMYKNDRIQSTQLIQKDGEEKFINRNNNNLNSNFNEKQKMSDSNLASGLSNSNLNTNLNNESIYQNSKKYSNPQIFNKEQRLNKDYELSISESNTKSYYDKNRPSNDRLSDERSIDKHDNFNISKNT